MSISRTTYFSLSTPGEELNTILSISIIVDIQKVAVAVFLDVKTGFCFVTQLIHDVKNLYELLCGSLIFKPLDP